MHGRVCVCVCVFFCILHTNRVQFVAYQASHYSHPLLILVELLRCCIHIQLERQVAVEIAASRSTSAIINNDKTDGDGDHDDESVCPKP